METKVNRREWVKTAAIIFLAVLLVLTFFSNTIMNASLPEVATQQVTQGTINAKIRASGTITANETYNVKLTQTRKIESVKCKVGQEVAAGDVLFVLEATESDELKQAQADLESKELEYQKSLITASNGTAQENRDVQKLRDAYNEALAIYNQYSTMDPSSIAIAKIKAEESLKDYKKDLEQAQKDLQTAQNDEEYKNIEAQITELETKLEPLKTAVDKAKENVETVTQRTFDGNTDSISSLEQQIEKCKKDIKTALGDLDADRYEYLANKYEADYLLLLRLYSNKDSEIVTDLNEQGLGELQKKLIDSGNATSLNASTRADELKIAYANLKDYYAKVSDKQEKLSELNAKLAYAEAKKEYDDAKSGSESLQTKYDSMKAKLERYQLAVERAQLSVDNQQEKVDNLTSAASAAETVKSAKTALEDKLFEVNQGDTASLDMQAAKKAIEDAKENIAKLTKDADAQEVTAKVGGTIATVSVTAGDTASADTPIATINQTDRGFTVKITVTNDQAKKVKVGDTAELVNYWGDATATLETIGNDPQNPSKNRQLTFRLTGSDIQPDSNVTLAIGQKSASYDAIVPTSAIRTDNNGSFVLAIVSKSTPLSTRYTATRVDVQILASDDKSSAVSGIGSGEFVITTSTKPIEAGTQVRLAENG